MEICLWQHTPLAISAHFDYIKEYEPAHLAGPFNAPYMLK